MGAIVSILATIGPSIAQGLIKLFEAKFGPKTGDVKKQGVMDVLLPLLDKLFAGTGIPVNQDLVSKLIDELVSQLNKSGQLGGAAATSTPAASVVSPAFTINGTISQVQK